MASVAVKRLAQLLPKLQSNALRVKTGGQVLCRKSHAYTGYRETNWEPNRPFIQRLAHFHAAIMWCYIYWCFRHNWTELTGEYIWPQRSEWPDKDLGIPSDDYD